MTAPTADPPDAAPSDPVARSGADIPLLDPAPARFGPVSRRLLSRTALGLGAVEAVGTYLVFGAATDAARAFGLSLVFPGAGFLYLGRPLAFVATAVAMVLALVLWWGLSAHAAIPLVWLASAIVAAALVDGPHLLIDPGTTYPAAIPVAYALVVGSLGWTAITVERRFRAKRAKVAELNAYLSSVELTTPVAAFRPPDPLDAELLRWCYDLADQPDDGLRGLDWGEQFHGGTQLRYQLNAHCWALSLYAANYLPNAPHQITESLARLVAKHTDLRVWQYWRTLNLLGNLDPNPDPIVRDNIMFSAFLGDVLNTFEAATGSHRFDEPGSLTFVWRDGRTFHYDHHSIVEAVRANYARSRLGFFPCEPGWSFTVCNIMGAQSMHGHDVLHGTDLWEANRDRWQATLDQEYLTPDGTYSHIRSNHLGLSWDTGEVPGGEYTTNGTGRFADILPGHAARARALDLRGAQPAMAMLSSMVVDGDLPLEMPPELERHRTASSSLPGWTKVIGGARLVGDDALAAAGIAGAGRQCATGERWPARPLAAGSSAFGSHLIVRWSAPLGLADLHVRGYVPPIGPVVERTAWDEILLVMARSADGASLDLVLEPRGEGGVRVPVELGQLEPGARYRVERGASVEAQIDADADGRARFDLEISGSVSVRIVPAATGGES